MDFFLDIWFIRLFNGIAIWAIWAFHQNEFKWSVTTTTTCWEADSIFVVNLFWCHSLPPFPYWKSTLLSQGRAKSKMQRGNAIFLLVDWDGHWSRRKTRFMKIEWYSMYICTIDRQKINYNNFCNYL